MLPVFTADEMRRVDQRASRDLGIPGATLMENAGRGAAERMLAALPGVGLPRRGARVVIVCGEGGNGRRGVVVARHLKRAGPRVGGVLVAAPGELRGDGAGQALGSERCRGRA